MNKKKKDKIEINGNITFDEIVNNYPELVGTLFEKGMHCIGCPMSAQESLEEGAIAHGLDSEELIRELNNKIKNGK